MLDAINGPVSNLDFQKLLFLYTKECEAEPSYEFVPYKFGGFSFTSYADKRRMVEAGLLGQDDQKWELTESGRKMARKNAVTPLTVAGFCRRHRKLRGNALIAEQYRKFPYYAIRSEILTKVLPDRQSQKRVAEARPEKFKPRLLTIGYEGRSLEAYLNSLIINSVTLLCDVRRNPISRKYGFSKSTLGKACEGVGIKYKHLPELGIASENRRGLRTQEDYDALFVTYKRESLPKQKMALEKIHAWLDQGESVSLTCFEALPGQCHRHCIAEAMQQMEREKFKICHL